MSQFNDEMNKKAVALSYDEESNSAPVIVASGSGYLAQRIVETARSNGIPVYEDNSLATVLSQMELGSEIPEQLYQAIVDIYVYFLNFGAKNKGGSGSSGQQSRSAGAATNRQQPAAAAAASQTPPAPQTSSAPQASPAQQASPAGQAPPAGQVTNPMPEPAPVGIGPGATPPNISIPARPVPGAPINRR